MSELEKFLEERSKIPIPGGDSAWVKLLAKELAMGVHKALWKRKLSYRYPGFSADSNLQEYINSRWGFADLNLSMELMQGHEYVEVQQSDYWLTNRAFELVDEVEPYNVFISYSRLDSSALALLVLARLKEHSFIPFVDMALEAGGKWHADLEDRIQQNEYFIILLGKETLCSDMTVKEIQWALKYEKTIIPIWHSGFDIKDKKWEDVPSTVINAIQQTNAIRVTGEKKETKAPADTTPPSSTVGVMLTQSTACACIDNLASALAGPNPMAKIPAVSIRYR